jgi:hypothetical protein
MQTEVHSSADPNVRQPETPLEELERAITQVWKDVFQLEQIGREENFFELGGNSLLGMDLTELLANRLGIQIPVLVLFRFPTIRELAEIIAAGGELP